MLTKRGNLLVAEAILAAVAYDWPDEINGDGAVACYANGREHGYYIRVQHPKKKELVGVAFSEFRNTDQIVVYFGFDKDFNPQGHAPSDRLYRRRKMFPCYHYAEAARFIVRFLTKSK